MNLPLKSKTILITGASSGIGEHIAYEAALKGANLILCARREDKLIEVKELCKKSGSGKIITMPMDISNPDSIDQLINRLNDDQIFVDVLINNAGIGHSEAFVDIDFQTVLKLFQVNVFGLMYLTQQLAVKMLDQGKGQIINIASLAGKVSTPNYATYGATKGAVISFSNALRMELKPHNVQVTTVNFGPVDTPFFDQIERSRREASANSLFTLTVDEAAQTVIKTIGTNKREVNRPILLAVGSKIYDLVPGVGDYLLMNYFRD